MPQKADISALRQQLHQFVCRTFLFDDDAVLDDEESLLDGGILDSTGVLELVSHLEETYGIRIADEEIVPENLDSIERLCRFVSSRSST